MNADEKDKIISDQTGSVPFMFVTKANNYKNFSSNEKIGSAATELK